MESLKLTWEQLREAGVPEDVIEATKKAFAEGRCWTLADMFPNDPPPQKLLDALENIIVDT